MVVLFAMAVGCSDDDGSGGSAEPEDFGPLAVIEDPATGSSDASAGTGTIRIGRRCVTFESENGTTSLLVWRSAEVRWDADARAIVFTAVSGDPPAAVTINDGDELALGGESFATDESPEPERDLTWVAAPHDECPPLAEAWAVHSVRPARAD